jgi:hypothetical protein
MDTRDSKRRRGGSGGAGAGGAVSAAAVSLGGGGLGGIFFASPSDGPPAPEHQSPGYGAGYDAGFLAGILAASQGRAPPPPGPRPVAATHGSAGASAPEPARTPFLALVEDFPDLFQKEVLDGSRAARAHMQRSPHRGEALGSAARRRRRGGAAGPHRGVQPVPLDVRLGRGERLPVARRSHM